MNHKLIFELDPRDHLTYIDLLKVSFSLIYNRTKKELLSAANFISLRL